MKSRKPLALAMSAFVLILLLGGCAQIQRFRSPQLALPAAAVPNYAVGEIYVYNNGRSETLIAKEGDTLTWRTNNGVVRKAYPNFIIPYLKWQTATRRGSSETDARPGMLWPLRVGNLAEFNFIRTAEDNNGGNRREYKQFWRCKVDGAEVVRIALGSYDTFRIVCNRYSGKIWRQTRTYNYAPSIGHYILRRDDYRSGPSDRRELVSYGFDSSVFSPKQQQTLTKLVQQTLSNNSDGKVTYWSGRNGRPRIGIIPLSTEINSKGLLCRSYKGVFTDNQRVRTNWRYACRRADGLWVRSLKSGQ